MVQGAVGGLGRFLSRPRSFCINKNCYPFSFLHSFSPWFLGVCNNQTDSKDRQPIHGTQLVLELEKSLDTHVHNSLYVVHRWTIRK